MRAPNLTVEAIHSAANELNTEGKKVSTTAVRERLGAGSFTTIAKALENWEPSDDLAKAPEAPEEILRLASTIWARAWSLAEQANQARAEDLAQKETYYRNELTEAWEQVESLETKLATLHQELKELSATVETERGRAMDCAARHHATAAERDWLRGLLALKGPAPQPT